MKKVLATFLFVTILTPTIYLGALPPREVEAVGVSGLAGCMFGALVSKAITAGLGLVRTAITYIGLSSTLGVASSAIGAAEDPTGASDALIDLGAVAGVPVTQIGPADLATKNNISKAAGSTALATAGSLMADTVMSFLEEGQYHAAMSLIFKECVLDPLAWILKKIIIETITQDILAWINGGFEGSPAFITDPQGFMNSLKDAAVGKFLFASGLDEYLCSPFRLEVIVDFYLDSTTPSYSDFGEMACTLDDVFANVAGSSIDASVAFGFGQVYQQGNISFEGGGFNAVFGSLEDRNNPYGTYFNLQSEAANRAHSLQAHENQLLIHGNGWFSLRCDLDEVPGVDNVCTPGQYVADQVNEWSSGALKNLEAADELAEIIDAAIAALVKKVLENVGSGGGNGLLDGGSGEYWTPSNELPPGYDDLYNDSINDGINDGDGDDENPYDPIFGDDDDDDDGEDTKPTLSFASPSNASIVPHTASFTLQLSSQSGVHSVQLSDNATVVATIPTGSLSTLSSTPITVALSSGDHTMNASAFDINGVLVSNATLSVNAFHPDISISSPKKDALFSSTAVIPLSAQMLHTAGVVGVQFKVDGKNIQPEISTPPYSTVLLADSVSLGTHVVSVVARHYSGITEESVAIQFTTTSNPHEL